MMKTHERFKAHLKAKGISQMQAAERLTVTFQTISVWANGHNVPPGLAKIAIKAVLGFKWPEGEK